MSDYYLNLFRTYRAGTSDEMCVTRAFVLACAKSRHGKRVFRALLAAHCSEVSPPDDMEPWRWDVEMRAERVETIAPPSAKNRFVLTLTPTGRMSPTPWGNLIEGNPQSDSGAHLRRLVPQGEASPEPSFEAFLRAKCSDVNTLLSSLSDSEREDRVRSAYWDVWRWLYAGARPDAVVWSNSFVCLVESKLYWDVSESQVRNHALKAFGMMSVPVCHLAWQGVYDTCLKVASEVEDPILEDFCSYLCDRPQLVRWNGFDERDRLAFEMRSGAREPEDQMLKRLDAHYTHCMEDLCGRGGYENVVERAYDWDFTVPPYQIIGNMGIGFWQESRLVVKWVAGWRSAQEAKVLASKSDLVNRGADACRVFTDDLMSLPQRAGVIIEFKAGQRFNWINANDSTFLEHGSRVALESIEDGSRLCERLQAGWCYELEFYQECVGRYGTVLGADEALQLKRDLIRRRNPSHPVATVQMAQRQPRWRLFPVFEVFLWLDPSFFLHDAQGVSLGKETQLDRLAGAVQALARFAASVSG
jgi:hypothetical protein